MKTNVSAQSAFGPQFSRRMIAVYADLLSKRALAVILLLAFLLVALVYLATAFLRGLTSAERVRVPDVRGGLPRRLGRLPG